MRARETLDRRKQREVVGQSVPHGRVFRTKERGSEKDCGEEAREKLYFDPGVGGGGPCVN